jgi:hypothetical protein
MTNLKNIVYASFLLVWSIIIAQSSYAEIVNTTNYKGKKYYVDVIRDGANAFVYFRINQNSCSNGDIKVLWLKMQTSTLKKTAKFFCKAKEVYDNGKTIAGCTAVGFSAGCAIATVATDGAAAVYCEAIWAATVKSGALKQCLSGTADAIASNLIGSQEWNTIQLTTNLSSNKMKEATLKAIDIMCNEIK